MIGPPCADSGCPLEAQLRIGMIGPQRLELDLGWGKKGRARKAFLTILVARPPAEAMFVAIVQHRFGKPPIQPAECLRSVDRGSGLNHGEFATGVSRT